MTAEAFAELVQAKRTGAGRWSAKCPAHADGTASLSIREGSQSKILVHCFAGCGVASVLTALHLRPRDLFAGPPPSPAEAALITAEREVLLRHAASQRAADRREWERIRQLSQAVDSIGARLAITPDDTALGALFHQACERLHDAETDAIKRPASTGLITKGSTS
jgi:hypothetical protein